MSGTRLSAKTRRLRRHSSTSRTHIAKPGLSRRHEARPPSRVIEKALALATAFWRAVHNSSSGHSTTNLGSRRFRVRSASTVPALRAVRLDQAAALRE